MKTSLLGLALAAAVTGSALAGPMEDGVIAFILGDYKTAEKQFRPLAEGGNAEAQRFMGTIYLGGHGVAKNSAMAQEWYRKSAERGDAESRLYLASMYETGQGGMKNYTEAAKLFRIGAEEGHVMSQIRLASILAYGPGELDSDFCEAAKWAMLATERGGKMPKAVVELIKANMNAGEVAIVQTLVRDWKKQRAEKAAP